MPVFQFQADLTYEAVVQVEAPDAHTAAKKFYSGEYDVIEKSGLASQGSLWGKGKEV